MDRRDHGAGMVGIDLGMDAVTKVEDMTAALAITGQYPGHFRADLCGLCIEDGGIEIALQGDPVADPRAGLADIGGPIEPQGVGAAVCHGLQGLASAFGE